MVKLPRAPRSRWGVALNVTVQVALLAWVVFVVNVWSFRHAWRTDLSAGQRFAVSPEVRQQLDQLHRPVRAILGFQLPLGASGRVLDRVFSQARRTVEEFRLINPDFGIDGWVNVATEPERWAQLRGDRELEVNRLYLVCDDRREELTLEDLARIRILREGTPLQEIEIEQMRVSEALTAALARLLNDDAPTIYFTQGNGEIPLTARGDEWSVRRFASTLSNRGFQVRPLDLRRSPRVPSDAALVVMVATGPRGEGFEPLRGEARRQLEAYVSGGGSLLLFPPRRGRSGLEELVARAGITIDSGVVAHMGLDARGMTAPTIRMLLRDFAGGHPITEAFDDHAVVELHEVHPLRIDAHAVALAQSPGNSWIETDSRTIRFDEGEERGRFVVAAAGRIDAEQGSAEAEVVGPTRSGKVVVVASWAAPLDALVTGGARRMLINSVYWLTDREELAAATGGTDVSRIVLEERVLSAFFWTAIVVIPLTSVLAGLFVFWLRRRR